MACELCELQVRPSGNFSRSAALPFVCVLAVHLFLSFRLSVYCCSAGRQLTNPLHA
jgi:hypothetical protein